MQSARLGEFKILPVEHLSDTNSLYFDFVEDDNAAIRDYQSGSDPDDSDAFLGDSFMMIRFTKFCSF